MLVMVWNKDDINDVENDNGYDKCEDYYYCDVNTYLNIQIKRRKIGSVISSLLDNNIPSGQIPLRGTLVIALN